MALSIFLQSCFKIRELSFNMLTQLVHSRSAVFIIFWSGLFVGTLDIFAAIYFSGATAEAVLKFIASGLFGKERVSEVGPPMIWLGLLIHYLIAYIWTVVFFCIFPKLFPLIRTKVVMSILIGVIIWLVMNRIVLPMSSIQQGPFSWIGFTKGCTILIAMIGVPLTWIFHRYYYGRTSR